MEFVSPPVLIVGFNRPDCLRQVFESVRQAKPEKLFLALDHPREGRTDDVAGWMECRKIFEKIDWPCEVFRNYADKNMGCRWRMGSAISWAFNHVERLIILEDDCVANRSFYRFCADILEYYKDNVKIGGVCGYLEHWKFAGRLKQIVNADYYFDRLNTCCGWATWKRAWDCFDPYMTDWPSLKEAGVLKKICHNKYEEEVMAAKFQSVYDGKKNSWAIAWALSSLKNDFMFVHSSVSLIKNVGFGPGATHSEGCSEWGRIDSEEIDFPVKHPHQISCNNYIERLVMRWFYVPCRLRRLASIIKQLIFAKRYVYVSNRPKVLWLCTYGNEDKWSRIKRWYALNKSTYGLWIPDLLRGFENDKDYDISVASFTVFQKKPIVSWKKNGINYYSYQKGLPIIGATLPIIDLLFNHLFNRIRINRIVRQVKPDIVHLFGSENPEYSSVIPLLGMKYKIVQTIQGFKMRDPDVGSHKGFVNDIMERRRCENEIKVLNIGNKFICEPDAANYLRTIREASFDFRPAYFPINEGLVTRVLSEAIDKKYDFLFLSRLVKAKGIIDFVKIVRIVRKINPNFSFAVAGPAMSQDEFERICKDENVDPTKINFLGKLPSQYDVYKLMAQAKVYLCPTYNDSFPTTVREAMSLGAVVIAYRTGGIPYINNEGEEPYVEIVNQGDFLEMAERACAIVNDSCKMNDMVKRGQSCAREKFSLISHIATLKQVYNEIMKGE